MRTRRATNDGSTTLDGASQSRQLCRFGATFSLSLLQAAGSSPACVKELSMYVEKETLTRDTPQVLFTPQYQKRRAVQEQQRN